MRRSLLLCLVAGGLIVPGADVVRYLRWQKMQPVVASLTAGGEKLPGFANAGEWDTWIYARDLQIRGQAEQGVEDSISALILFGNSFTNLPRIGSAKQSVDAAGSLTPAALARVDAFIQALDERDDERLATVLALPATPARH